MDPGTTMWPSAAEGASAEGRDFAPLDAGVQTVIYTDISRDGAEQGTNLALYRELAKLRAWTSLPPRRQQSGGAGSPKIGTKPPFWGRPCTRAVWI
ncbi:MAG: HisA/HisF-related TIM barrel protein [Dysosmobacter welbionis]